MSICIWKKCCEIRNCVLTWLELVSKSLEISRCIYSSTSDHDHVTHAQMSLFGITGHSVSKAKITVGTCHQTMRYKHRTSAESLRIKPKHGYQLEPACWCSVIISRSIVRWLYEIMIYDVIFYSQCKSKSEVAQVTMPNVTSYMFLSIYCWSIQLILPHKVSI